MDALKSTRYNARELRYSARFLTVQLLWECTAGSQDRRIAGSIGLREKVVKYEN